MTADKILLVLKIAGAALTIVFLAGQIAHLAVQFTVTRRAKRLQSLVDRDASVPQFTEDEIRRHLSTYVRPDCAQTDPANETDIAAVTDVRENIFHTVDRFVTHSGQRRHQLILADSGMGKTSFCLNYFDHVKRQRPNDGAVLLSLAQPDALRKLAVVPGKSRAIAILDALDEDPKAIEDGTSRLYEVLEAAADFRAVIITCRSQFFPTDLAIPTETGVSILTPRNAGQNASYKLYRLYLSPFSDRQISQFIRSHFPLRNPWVVFRRRRAHQLVRDVRELAVRPMLLELLPLLVRDRKPRKEIFELYQYMVDKWFEREASWIPEDRLRAVSIELAVQVHTRHVEGLGDRVSLSQLQIISSQVSGEAGAWDHLTTRSLLNRDSAGNLKFAHRSIMEYLFVVAALGGDERCFRVKWTDFMKEVLISWGYTEDGRARLDVAEKILGSDLAETALLPLSEPPARPSFTSAPDFELAATRRDVAHGAHRSASGLWRRNSFRIVESDGIARITDIEFNLEWQIQERAHWVKEGLIDEYRRTIGETQRMFNTGAIYRLPSYAEFITLVEGLSAAKRDDLLPDGELYLLGDMLGDRRHVAVRIGTGLRPLGMILNIDKERAASFTNRKVTAYEFGIHADPSAFRFLRAVGLGVKSGID